MNERVTVLCDTKVSPGPRRPTRYTTRIKRQREVLLELTEHWKKVPSTNEQTWNEKMAHGVLISQRLNERNDQAVISDSKACDSRSLNVPSYPVRHPGTFVGVTGDPKP